MGRDVLLVKIFMITSASVSVVQCPGRSKYLEFSFTCVGSTMFAEPGARTCVEAQRSRFLGLVWPLINPAAQPVVLVDMPDYWNLGDSFIWLGILTFMDVLGAQQPALETMPACHYQACDKVALSRALGSNGTIFMTGGGNFGCARGRATNTQCMHTLGCSHVVPVSQLAALLQRALTAPHLTVPHPPLNK